MSGTLSAQIAAQSVPNDGNPHVIASQSFPAITPVNVLAGQSVTGTFTLQTDAAPSTYPTPGVIDFRVSDQFGNRFPVQISYTGTSGSSFTGCTVTNSPTSGLSTLLSPATPEITGSVSLNRTGAAGSPWLNTLTSASNLSISIQSSADGGTTWRDEARADSIQGGIFTDKNGTVTTTELDVGPINPKANAVRMLVIVNGPSAIEISGTATVLTR